MVAQRLDSPPVTYAQWLALPETTQPTEVVDGRVVVNAAPGRRHQQVVARLLVVLSAAVPPDLEALPAPLDWVLRRDPLLVRQPDLVVVPVDPAAPPRLVEPPVVVVEVVSAGSTERDLVHKRSAYAEAGLGWYWLVDPDLPQVAVLRNTGGGFETAASVAGDGLLDVIEPFAVRLRPADLV